MRHCYTTPAASFGAARFLARFAPGARVSFTTSSRLAGWFCKKLSQIFQPLKSCRCFTRHGRGGFRYLKPGLLLSTGLLTFCVFAPPLLAETREQPLLLQARELSEEGKFAQVIQMLEPWVQDESRAHDEVNRGEAWALLGPAYEAVSNYDSAQRAYESSIRLLRTQAATRLTLAAALNNLASLEILMGNSDGASNLLRKAKKIYTDAENHAGLAEVATTRTILALDRKDQHAAHRLLADVLVEANQANNLRAGDWAEIYSIKGAVEARDRDFSAAVVDYQQSAGLWMRTLGPKCDLVALQYILQADAYRELGDYSKAQRVITEALRTLEQTTGRSTSMYASAELAYARLLRATGKKVEAALKEKEAQTVMEAAKVQRCMQCSISAESLR